MKKMAIVAPSDSPIPAVCGGAVETLTTYFLTENEKKPTFEIDVYCCCNKNLDGMLFNYTHIMQVQKPLFHKIIKMYCSIINRLYTMLNISKARFYFDKHIAKSIDYSKKYDYILIENNMNVFKYILKYRLGNEKLYFHLHNDVGDSAYKNKSLCQLVYRNCAGIFCASKYLFKRFEDVVEGDYYGKIKLLTNCVDFHMFTTQSDNIVNDIKNKYGIENDEYIVLYSGRITPEKGVLELVQAVRSIDKDVHMRCIVIGGNWFGSRKENAYMNLIRELAREDNRIILLGYIEYKDMAKYYQLADLTIVPSKWEEPFGMVALEALSMGCPIAVTKKGGLKNIPNDLCGDYIENEPSMQEGIRKVILKNMYRTKQEQNDRRVNAYNRAHEDFYDTNQYFEILKEEIINNE